MILTNFREPALDLRPSWILPGAPDPYGIDARLAARKQARINGQIYVASHVRMGRA